MRLRVHLRRGRRAGPARSSVRGRWSTRWPPPPSIEPTVEATWDISTSLLVQAATASIAYGVVIVLAAWLAGPTHAAVRTRDRLHPLLSSPRLAYGSVAALVLLLVAWGPTPATQKPLGVLLLIVLLVGGMRALRHQVAEGTSRPSAAARSPTRPSPGPASSGPTAGLRRPRRGRACWSGPAPPPFAFTSKPSPLSRTSKRRRSSSRSSMRTAAPGACLPTFCRASRQEKYTALSTSCG